VFYPVHKKLQKKKIIKTVEIIITLQKVFSKIMLIQLVSSEHYMCNQGQIQDFSWEGDVSW